MNRKHIALGLVTMLLLTGCGTAPNNSNTDESRDVTISSINQTDESVTSVNEDNFETIGDIIEFGEGEVHILTGDIAEIYQVSNDELQNFYLGQTVSVTKETENEYSLMPYLTKDFSIRHTNMGNIIERVTGEVISFTDEQVTISTSKGELTYQKSEDLIIEVGKAYDFDVVDMGESKYTYAAYHEDQKIILTITELNRQENGELEILGVDASDGEYIVRTYQAEKNFNYSDLTIGQTVAAYAPIVLTSYPAQVPATRIDLISDLPMGVTNIDYDFIGEVVNINNNILEVLSGDMIQTFDVDPIQLNNIYLGETVKVYSKNDIITVESYIIDDFSKTYTAMGEPIDYILGQITNISKESEETILTIQINDKTISALYYGSDVPEMNKDYEFATFKTWDDATAIHDYFDPSSIISMTITGIERASNGELMLSAKDKDNGEYVVGTSFPQKNFNLSQLKEGDVINVYVDAIMESWPMQVNTRKIIIVTER